MQLPNAGSDYKKSRIDDTITGEHVSHNVHSNGIVQSSNKESDFSEFMWMACEDLEAFDQKVCIEIIYLAGYSCFYLINYIRHKLYSCLLVHGIVLSVTDYMGRY